MPAITRCWQAGRRNFSMTVTTQTSTIVPAVSSVLLGQELFETLLQKSISCHTSE